MSFLILVSLVQFSINAEVLYDISFPSDLFSDGETVVADVTTNTPSSIVFGSQEIAYGHAGQEGNWAIFNTPDCFIYDQMEFEFLGDRNEIYVQIDIYVDGIDGSDNSFGIFLDSNGYGARAIRFHGLGRIYLFNRGSFWLSELNDGKRYNLKLHANTIKDSFIISIDDEEVYNGVLQDTDLSGLRLSLSPWTGRATTCDESIVAVSNIKVYEFASDLEPDTFQPSIELTSGNVVSEDGGRIRYNIAIKNNDANTPHDHIWWIKIDLPSDVDYSVKKYGPASTIGGGEVFYKSRGLTVPHWVSAGSYDLTLVVVNTESGKVTTATTSIVKE